jgi:hypothetical protein
MLVGDSRPYQSSLFVRGSCNGELQPKLYWVSTIELWWQVILVDINGILSSTCIFGLVEFEADLHKASFILKFSINLLSFI